ncbi:MAG: hypothetical protein NXH85_07660 [Pseudomonadaceae bacterium]|nr:hypothetical protein [Pseudomonadaceae bacterium]
MNILELRDAIYEDLESHLDQVVANGDTIRLRLVCDDWEGSSERRRFHILLRSVHELDISPSHDVLLSVFEDHPLTWMYNSTHYDVYFSKVLGDPYEVIGRLYSAHESLYGGWRPFSEFLNADVTILEGGHGLLIRGPEPAIKKYISALNGLAKTREVPTHTRALNCTVLLIDDMYAVCEGISVEEVGDEA